MFSKNPTGKRGTRYSHLVDTVGNKAGWGEEFGGLECVILRALWFNYRP